MARRLTANVALRNAKTGLVEVFEAGDDVPGWAADLITTPGLLENVEEAGTADDEGSDPTDDPGGGPTAEDGTDESPASEQPEGSQAEPDASEDEAAVEVRPVGSGWHEIVVDGEVVDKIRGKEAAVAAAEAIAAADGDDDPAEGADD